MDGWTPLRCAALSRNELIVRQLLELGVDVNAPFPDSLEDTWMPRNGIKGMNILIHAAPWCTTPESVEILDFLVKAGAHVHQNGISALFTTLSRPTRKGQRNYSAEWVLDNFPTWDVNNSSSDRGLPPLYYSSWLPPCFLLPPS